MESNIPQGLFGIQDDHNEAYQSLNERFVKNRSASFFFHFQGDAMEPNIFHGDIVLVDRSIEDFHKRICVVSLNGALICRRIYMRLHGVLLKPDNSTHKELLVKNGEHLRFWGVVTSRHGEVL